MGSTYTFSDEEWNVLHSPKDSLHPLEIALNGICTEDANLLKSESSIKFISDKLQSINKPLCFNLSRSISHRYTWRKQKESVALLSYLHDPNSMKNEPSTLFPFPSQSLKNIVHIHLKGFTYLTNIREISVQTQSLLTLESEEAHLNQNYVL